MILTLRFCSGFLAGHAPPPVAKQPSESVGLEPALFPVGFWEESPALARSKALRTPFLAYSQNREPESEQRSGFRFSLIAPLLEMNLDQGSCRLPVMLSRADRELFRCMGSAQIQERDVRFVSMAEKKKKGSFQSCLHCVTAGSCGIPLAWPQKAAPCLLCKLPSSTGFLLCRNRRDGQI